MISEKTESKSVWPRVAASSSGKIFFPGSEKSRKHSVLLGDAHPELEKCCCGPEEDTANENREEAIGQSASQSNGE